MVQEHFRSPGPVEDSRGTLASVSWAEDNARIRTSPEHNDRER